MNSNFSWGRGNTEKNKISFKLKAFFAVIIIAVIIIVIYYVHAYYTEKMTHKLYPRPFPEIVAAASEKYDIPVEVIYSVIKVESNFDITAESRAGALGLMQILPDTFLWLCERRKEKLDINLLFDPAVNIDYGVYYLRYLLDYYKGDMTLVYAAYNAGMGNVNKWLKSQNGTLTYIPYEETRKYIDRITNTIDIYKKLIY